MWLFPEASARLAGFKLYHVGQFVKMIRYQSVPVAFDAINDAALRVCKFYAAVLALLAIHLFTSLSILRLAGLATCLPHYTGCPVCSAMPGFAARLGL